MSEDRFSLDFVGVGAARCGTTWLARCLAEHPAIQLPDRKELHYFNSDAKYEPSLGWLRERFEPDAGTSRGGSLSGVSLRGEFTPRYLLSDDALRRLHHHFPNAKVLVLLRDPFERAWSQYCYFRFNKKKEPERNFERALEGFYFEDYVEKSRYGRCVERLLQHVPREQIWLGRYEQIRREPQELLRSLFLFLEIDPEQLPQSTSEVINASKRGRATPSDGWARAVRWLTYGNAFPLTRYRSRALQWVERRNERLDARGPVAQPELPSLEVRQRVFARYFAEDLQRAESLLGWDLSAWRPEVALSTEGVG